MQQTLRLADYTSRYHSSETGMPSGSQGSSSPLTAGTPRGWSKLWLPRPADRERKASFTSREETPAVRLGGYDAGSLTFLLMHRAEWSEGSVDMPKGPEVTRV